MTLSVGFTVVLNNFTMIIMLKLALNNVGKQIEELKGAGMLSWIACGQRTNEHSHLEISRHRCLYP